MLREYQTGIFFMKNLLHIVKRDRGLNALQVCLACFPTYFLFFLSQQPSHVDPKNLCMNGHSLQLQLKAVYNFSVFSRNGITFVILTSFIHMCLLHEHYKHPLQVVVSRQYILHNRNSIMLVFPTSWRPFAKELDTRGTGCMLVCVCVSHIIYPLELL